MNKKFKTYSGQALAIIMIVLVVSSIIGFSVFNRSLRDKKSTIQERDSGEAYEVVDILLDTMLQYLSEEWMDGRIAFKETYETNGTTYNLQDLLATYNPDFDITSLNMCKVEEGSNKYTLKLDFGNADTMYQVEPGQAFTFLVEDGDQPPAGCSIKVTFVTAGLPENTGFMLSKIFRKSLAIPTQIEDYNYSHAETYCLFGACNNFQKLPSGLPSFLNPFFINMNEPLLLDRAQIIAINNPIQFQFEPTAQCGDRFKTLVLRTSATCNGVYRAKEIIVPVHRAHFSIFNYVLFNGNGPMDSNN